MVLIQLENILLAICIVRKPAYRKYVNGLSRIWPTSFTSHRNLMILKTTKGTDTVVYVCTSRLQSELALLSHSCSTKVRNVQIRLFLFAIGTPILDLRRLEKSYMKRVRCWEHRRGAIRVCGVVWNSNTLIRWYCYMKEVEKGVGFMFWGCFLK